MEAEKYNVFRNRFFYRANGKMIPRAHRVWLNNNPLFKEIPEGYVVHHLDGDPTNDDPSNLVIMRFHLHAAYHYKYVVPETEIIEVTLRDVNLLYEPYREIKVMQYDKKHPKWMVLYWGKDPSGTRKRMRFYSDYNGNSFDNQERAISFANELSTAFGGTKVRVMPQGHLSTGNSSL